jgi:hypothetical protein
MAFYIVVRNRKNPEQKRPNIWADDHCIKSITTTLDGKGNARVEFKDCHPLNLKPPITPERGQSSYDA